LAKGKFGILINIKYNKKPKYIGECNTRASVLEVHAVFRQRMQRLSMAKKFLSSCHWNRRGVFFLLGRHMVLVMGQFVIGDAFFLFSSLLLQKSHSPFKILELSFYLLRFQFQYLFF
jgi:hypothetical protein